MVVNSIISGMVANANKPCLTIYQVGSSLRNPLTVSKLVDINYRYFNKNPWIDGQGVPVKIKKGKLVKDRLHFLMLSVQPIPKLMVYIIFVHLHLKIILNPCVMCYQLITSFAEQDRMYNVEIVYH